MKLTYFQLESHLAKKLSPVYIVSGDELLLKQDAIQWIAKTAKAAGFNEHIPITPDADQLYTWLYSHSLLANKKLLKLDCRDTSPNKSNGKILEGYANNPSSENILVIDIGKIDNMISKSSWYQTLEKIGMVITIWPIPREQLPQWIIQRAKKYKMDMPLDAANLLADFVEGNLIAAANAIEKLYLSQTSIDTRLIETILTDESHFTIFDLVENIIAKQPTRSLHILESLKLEGIEPTLILWGISRELRILSDCFQQLKEGLSFEILFQKNKIFPRRQAAVRHFLTRFSMKDCWHLLSRAAEIDKTMKGALPGNVWHQLQLFCLRNA